MTEGECLNFNLNVIPAKAGIHFFLWMSPQGGHDIHFWV
jgi:hypothetical protein